MFRTGNPEGAVGFWRAKRFPRRDYRHMIKRLLAANAGRLRCDCGMKQAFQLHPAIRGRRGDQKENFMANWSCRGMFEMLLTMPAVP